jgi:hypothetical protein
MIGVAGGGWAAWRDCTLRELVVAYDAHQLDKWDQTALVACLVSNLTTTVGNLASKRGRRKPRQLTDFHPFRAARSAGTRITKSTFGVLRMIGDAIRRRGCE